MPRVLPSDVVTAADRMFPDMVQSPNQFPLVGPDQVPRLVALARLVDAVPPELLTLDSTRYAGLLASIAFLRALGDTFQASRQSISLNLVGYDKNPVALMRDAMAACPDQAPSSGTTALTFIPDADLRESIRLDMSSANADLVEGEWKGSTVLAGSAIEAMLLWALDKHERQKPRARAAAVAALVQTKILTRQQNADLEQWDLNEYVEVAAGLGLITPDTANQARLAR